MKNNKYYFKKGDENCFNLEHHKKYMIAENILKMDVFLGKRETKTNMFYCKFFQEVGERGNCSSECKGYKAMNGVSGACTSLGYTYENTGKKITIHM